MRAGMAAAVEGEENRGQLLRIHGRGAVREGDAERIAISSYQEIARWLGDKDATTRRLMEEILAVEEEHADDLLSLLADLDT